MKSVIKWICKSYSTLVFMKIVDGSLSMETVEEQLRELATNCIQESQEKPLTNLAWWSATIPWRNTAQQRLIHPRLYVIHTVAGDEKLGIWQSFHLPFSITIPRTIYISTFDWCFQITFFLRLFLRKFICWRSGCVVLKQNVRIRNTWLLGFHGYTNIQLLLDWTSFCKGMHYHKQKAR